MKTVAKMVVTGVSTVALACGIGAGMAYADPPTPTPAPTATASPTPKAKPGHHQDGQGPRMKRLAVLRRALHGEVTLAGEQHRVVVFQRGPVEKVDDTSLTVKSVDGYTATYVVNADTKVRKSGDKSTVAELKAGDKVLVVANKEGSTLTAFRIGSAD